MLKKSPFLTLFEEAHKNAFEKERREIIARKRDKACSKPDTKFVFEMYSLMTNYSVFVLSMCQRNEKTFTDD